MIPTHLRTDDPHQSHNPVVPWLCMFLSYKHSLSLCSTCLPKVWNELTITNSMRPRACAHHSRSESFCQSLSHPHPHKHCLEKRKSEAHPIYHATLPHLVYTPSNPPPYIRFGKSSLYTTVTVSALDHSLSMRFIEYRNKSK